MFNLNIQNYFGNSSIVPDVSYCYSSSIDFLEITAGDLNYFLKETNFDLTLLFDDCEQNNLNFIKTLDNFFIKWYEEIANEKQKSYVFYKFLFNLEYQLDIFNKGLFQFYNDGIIDKRLSYKKLLENINSENIDKNSKINKNINKYIEKTTLQNLWNNLYGENKDYENKNKIKRLFSFYELVLNKINNYSKNVFHTLDSLMKEEYLINFNKSSKIIDNLRTSEIVNEIEIGNNFNKNIFKKKIENRKVFKEAKKMLFNKIILEVLTIHGGDE